MQFYKILLIICLGLLLQACTAGRIAQQLEGGKASFRDAEFKSSFRQLLPLAAEGNAEAQYAVGYMYYYGYGVPQDTMSGLFWMTKSAEKGNRSAINALNLIHQREAEPEGCFVGNKSNLSSTSHRVYKDSPQEKDAVLQALPPKRSAFSALPPSHRYVLQVFGAYHLADVEKLQSDKKWQSSTRVWRTTYQGKPWYVLTYGGYSTVAEANAALDRLPKSVAELKPWVRPVSQLSMHW